MTGISSQQILPEYHSERESIRKKIDGILDGITRNSNLSNKSYRRETPREEGRTGVL